MLSPSSRNFIEFLQGREQFDEHESPQPGEWANAGNTIGMLALRLNLLSVEQIDKILDVQESRGHADLSFQETLAKKALFGQVAVELGFLREDQVQTLLEIQEFHRQLELGAQLVLGGKLDLSALVGHLRDFMQLEQAGCA